MKDKDKIIESLRGQVAAMRERVHIDRDSFCNIRCCLELGNVNEAIDIVVAALLRPYEVASGIGKLPADVITAAVEWELAMPNSDADKRAEMKLARAVRALQTVERMNQKKSKNGGPGN